MENIQKMHKKISSEIINWKVMSSRIFSKKRFTKNTQKGDDQKETKNLKFG